MVPTTLVIVIVIGVVLVISSMFIKKPIRFTKTISPPEGFKGGGEAWVEFRIDRIVGAVGWLAITVSAIWAFIINIKLFF